MRVAIRKQDNLTHYEDSDRWFQVVQWVDDAEAIAVLNLELQTFRSLFTVEVFVL